MGPEEIDELRIQQIFTNLLNNAMQSMRENPFILIKISKLNNTLSISDRGTGIPIDDQPFIFERFYRGENKKYSTSGLGLGLPLSKMMAKSLNGDLLLIKSDEHGSSFELSLPIKKLQ